MLSNNRRHERQVDLSKMGRYREHMGGLGVYLNLVGTGGAHHPWERVAG